MAVVSTQTQAEEACYRLRDLFCSRLGSVDGYCIEASTILACALRKRGYKADVCRGSYTGPDGPVFHAHVLCDEVIYDPTREQFEDAPLVALPTEACYFEDGEYPRYNIRAPKEGGAGDAFLY